MSAHRTRSPGRRRDELLGMNARNLDFIYPLNPRRHLRRADDKLVCLELLASRHIPVPRTLAVFAGHRDLPALDAVLDGGEGFAIKPACGFGGKGIVIVRRSDGGGLVALKARGEAAIDAGAVREHILAILAGVFSLERVDDRAFLEELLEPEDVLGAFSYRGLPDVRIIVCRGTALMAMLRLPTRASRGRANLHQGALGAGLDIASGRTTHAVLRGRPAERHPDLGVPVAGLQVPFWNEVLQLAVQSAAATELGFLGVDVVIDRRRGPLVMEVNARPGLTIQLANRRGLAGVLSRGGTA